MCVARDPRSFARSCSSRPECAEHSMLCFTRLIRLLLGESAIAAEKNECGKELVVLGILVRRVVAVKSCAESCALCFEVAPSNKGISFTLSDEKASKYTATIEAALASGRLSAGDAGKLAGRLSWSTQHLFFRVGRAMLRAIFDQKRSRCDARPRLAVARCISFAQEWPGGSTLAWRLDLVGAHLGLSHL